MGIGGSVCLETLRGTDLRLKIIILSFPVLTDNHSNSISLNEVNGEDDVQHESVRELNNFNVAILPRRLQLFLWVLHLGRAWSGIMLCCFGMASVFYYESFDYFHVLVLGITAIFSGVTGFFATKFHSLAAHGGCVGTSAITLYLGMVGYTKAIGTTSLGHPFLLSAANTILTSKSGLLMCDVILIATDLVISASSIGFGAVVLYISTTTRSAPISVPVSQLSTTD